MKKKIYEKKFAASKTYRKQDLSKTKCARPDFKKKNPSSFHVHFVLSHAA